ncbi:MAG: tetraacyldisaccharide 4'-kinase, partial [Candidatus Methylomirabilales bacterium]
KRLWDRGIKPLVLLRGYRGKVKTPLLVSDGVDILAKPPLAGDEAYLLATKLPGVPVVTGADRYLAGSWAFSRFHPDVFLLDDGFQHWKLYRDLDIVLLDGRNPFGYGHLLPRGLLREPPEALGRADLVAITTDHPDFAQGRPQGFEELLASLRRYHPKAPIILRRLPRPFLALSDGREACDELGRVVGLSALKGKKALAFSGIGNPSSFEAHLRRLGVEVLEHRVFPDHHRYRLQELRILAETAKKKGAEVLLTTEKDMVRIPPWPSAIPLFALRIELEVIEGEQELEQVVEQLICPPQRRYGERREHLL